jgi:hypothetical protein
MTKHFIKVTKTNGAKNKLQTLCIDKLTKLDQILCNSYPEAKEEVERHFYNALKAYAGTAKEPELRDFISNAHEQIFYIEDLIYISIYEVKIEVINP